MHAQFTRNTMLEGNASRLFVAVATLLLAASITATVGWCASMQAMGGMPMPGGWTMSMAWMPLSGQGWWVAALSFTGMWTVMMIAMMLPSLIPVLWRYRQRMAQAGGRHPDTRTLFAGLGYFLVWVVFGVAAFPVGAVLAAVAMRIHALARMVPLTIGAILLLAGLLQFSAWKAHGLACCRDVPHHGSAWRDGLHHGLHCARCCSGLMLAWLAVGVMDPGAMVLVTAAVTAERLAPVRWPTAWIVGVLLAGFGVLFVTRAIGLA